MTYEQCHFNKRTEGSRALRQLFGKFNKHDATLDHMAWGPIYTGDSTNDVKHFAEEKVREQVAPLKTRNTRKLGLARKGRFTFTTCNFICMPRGACANVSVIHICGT